MKKITLSIVVGLVSLVLAGHSFGTVDVQEKITIVADESRKDDAGYALAIEDITDAIRSTACCPSIIWQKDSNSLPEGNLILTARHKDITIDPWKPAKPEGFRIKPASVSTKRASKKKKSAERKVLLIEGDRPGVKYGLFKLAERIRLGDELCKIELESAPAFGFRLFSEVGELLDIPDIGYYTDSPPYVNEQMLREEVDEAKRLLPYIVKLGFNAFSVLNLGVEEYIDYRYLDKKVYADDDRHRVRSPIFCKYLSELCDYAHSVGLDVYLHVYEIQYPQKLDELYGVDLNSPNIELIVNARYKELFERVPLDGMKITATEVHPRAGYKGKMLWYPKGRAAAGRMATIYHNACKAVGKKCIFRMWRVSKDAEGVKEVIQNVPSDTTLAVKYTPGDFYLKSPISTAITSGIARNHPMVVLYDTLPAFDGWSRLFIYMKRWGPFMQACRDNGFIGIVGWGSWAPGCIWPDFESAYMTNADGTPQSPGTQVSWCGKWRTFRMFTRGFTPGQVNPYLLSRLTWNPDEDIRQIAEDFATLHIGRANAKAAAEALMATEDAFAEEYVKGSAHPIYIKWTMVFAPHDDGKTLEKAYQENPLDVIIASNNRALKKVDQMEQAFSKTSAAAAPDKKKYAAFKEGIDKTALYLRTFYLWRQCWWRNRANQDLTGRQKAVNTLALQREKAQLKSLFDQWSKYPEEAGYWRVTLRYGQPNLSPKDIFPYWYPRGDTSMEKSAESFGG